VSILARIRPRALVRARADIYDLPDGQRRYYYYEGRPLMDPPVTISRAAQSCGLLGEGILRQHLDVISSVLRNGRRGLRVVKPRVRLHLHCLRIGIPRANLTVTPRGLSVCHGVRL
jgi:hypothetical protein